MPAQPSGGLDVELDRARQLLRSGRFEESLQVVVGAEAHHPEHAAVVFLKGILLRRLGRSVEALSLLESVVSHRPELAAAHQELGLARQALGRIGAAKKSFARAVALDGKLAESWRQLGRIFAAEGQEESSRKAFRSELIAVSRHPLIVEAVELVEKDRLGQAEGICRDYLTRYPNDVNAIRLLAEIGLKLGMFEDAEKLLERCLELAPNFHLARNNYANVLGRMHQFDKALQEISRLERAEPDNLSHSVLAASILVHAGDFEGAVRRYRAAIEAAPGHARMWLSYGHVLKTVGQTDASIEAYRRALELEPTLGEAYWSLANLKTYRFRDEEIAAMRGYLSQPKLDAGDCFHLCFALGKALEDGGQYDESFAYYASGNELKKQLSGYDSGANTNRMKEMKRQCTAALFRAKGDWGDPSPDPIFIVGLPRSGSTLLEQILASHSRVEGTMELPYILQFAHRLGGRPKSPDAAKYPAVLHELTADQCRSLGREYLQATRIQRGRAPFFIDKMPNNFQHVGLISLILPNARIIDARRHALACCFSCFKQLFAAGQEFTYGLDDIGRYYRDYVELMDHWDAVLPGRILRVEYEQVVGDLESQVRRLLEFCGLDFEPACLEFHANRRAVRTASSEQVRRPIYDDAVDQWRHFEQHLGPLRRALGPELGRDPVADAPEKSINIHQA
jgi:tetratricopeptide (TPR) repeat protein